MNESISMLKLTIIAALGVIAAYFNALMIPIVVLVFVNALYTYTETDIPVEAELIDPEEGVVNNDE